VLVDADFFEVDTDVKGGAAKPAATKEAPAAPKQVSNSLRYYYIFRKLSQFNSNHSQLQLLPLSRLKLPRLPQFKPQLPLSKHQHLPHKLRQERHPQRSLALELKSECL
jgi:hypothetical protein